jgi:UDP-N-acetylglucosamine enolpyruvyl transferase
MFSFLGLRNLGAKIRLEDGKIFVDFPQDLQVGTYDLTDAESVTVQKTVAHVEDVFINGLCSVTASFDEPKVVPAKKVAKKKAAKKKVVEEKTILDEAVENLTKDSKPTDEKKDKPEVKSQSLSDFLKSEDKDN